MQNLLLNGSLGLKEALVLTFAVITVVSLYFALFMGYKTFSDYAKGELTHEERLGRNKTILVSLSVMVLAIVFRAMTEMN